MAERIKVQCPDCGTGFKVDAGHVGKRAKCKHCGNVFTIEEEIPLLKDAEEASHDIADDPVGLQGDIELPPYASGTADSPGGWPGVSPRGQSAGNAGGLVGLWSSLNSRVKIAVFGSIGVLLLVGIWVAASGTGSSAQQEGPPPQASKPLIQVVKSPKPAVKTPDQFGPLPAVNFKQNADQTQMAFVQIRRRHAQMTDLWVYLPPGTHAKASLPCVFICPASWMTIMGGPFGPHEMRDFFPLLARGVAVCFYSLDGSIGPGKASNIRTAQAIRDFMNAHAGMNNLADAIDLVLADVPEVDPSRLGTCGLNSAGTIAVMAVAQEPRISAAAVMGPVLDLPARLDREVMDYLEGARLDWGIDDASPSNVSSFSHPIYIIVAMDDGNVPVSEAKAFAAKHPNQVTLETLPSGGHGGAHKAFDFLARTFKATPPAAVTPTTLSPTMVTPPRARP